MPTRDMDLIRTILLHVEQLPPIASGGYDLRGVCDDIAEKGSEFAIAYHHMKLLIDAGYIDEFGNGVVRGLRWEGHDYVDSIRDAETWKSVKTGAERVGGWTADLIRDLAKAYIKKKMTDTLGISF